MLPVRDWATASVDPRLNGLLLNWYDGQLGHYIGRHRDSTKNMVTGAPIVTVSLSDTRNFRLRQRKGSAVLEFSAANGSVFVMPYDTNQHWTHEVPRQAKHRGKRISVTLRAFETLV